MTRGTNRDGRRKPTLLYLMKQVELAVRAELDDLTRPVGLTALQYTALTVLERHPDLTAAHLARHSFVTSQSMGDMVTALLDRGLIERHRDLADQRRLVIALTPEGRRLLDTAAAGRGARGPGPVGAVLGRGERAAVLPGAVPPGAAPVVRRRGNRLRSALTGDRKKSSGNLYIRLSVVIGSPP